MYHTSGINLHKARPPSSPRQSVGSRQRRYGRSNLSWTLGFLVMMLLVESRMVLNEPAMLTKVMTSHRSMSSSTTSSFRSGQEQRGLFPPWRRRSNNGRRNGEGKWRREEERATTVPNREGKAKSRWMVASLPWYTKRRPGLHVRLEIVEKGSPSSH